MKNLSFVMLIVTFISILGGCNLACVVEEKVVTGLGQSIATTLQCANVAQINSDIQSVLSKINICATTEKMKDLKQGTIANAVCPLIASTAVGYLGNVVPASWQCAPVQAGQTLVTAVTAACELLPL